MENFISGNEFTFSCNQLTPEKFNAAMQQFGCILIKNVFDQNEIDVIKHETLDLFYIIKNLQHNHLLSKANEKYLAGGHPAGILPSLHSLEQVLNKKSFIDCLQSYFKENDFVVNVESTGIRRCDPHQWKNFLPWHQDVFNRNDAFITCWMPLMLIDEWTPGIDLVPKKLVAKLDNQDGLDVAYNGKGLSDDLINQKVTVTRWRPQMNIGDVIIFDPYCIHRTSYGEGFTNERYSIDIRIHPKNCIPEESWKTNIINLPSTKSNIKTDQTTRALFDFRHLVSLNLPPPEKIEDKKSLFKKILLKLAQ